MAAQHGGFFFSAAWFRVLARGRLPLPVLEGTGKAVLGPAALRELASSADYCLACCVFWGVAPSRME